VVGTTGWYQQYEDVCNFVETQNAALFTATNFSIGVNLFFQINKKLASLMNDYAEYNVSMEEVHHTQKLDAPSGTAITTAENILSEYTHKKGWECPQSEDFTSSDTKKISIEAIRQDNVPGIHRVYWKSEIDCIEIAHTAYNRKGFATGAVVAAEWLVGKKGIYTMKDLMGF
jgi:4-hydroxy-tetrahydrodipicolinate reductase